jgi:hypothetical protein
MAEMLTPILRNGYIQMVGAISLILNYFIPYHQFTRFSLWIFYDVVTTAEAKLR